MLSAVTARYALAAALTAAAALAASPAGAPAAQPGSVPWWIRAIAADGIAASGSGKPVAFVDTGIDMGLAIFSRRRDTFPLNSQRRRRSQFHGPTVASLVVAAVSNERPLVTFLARPAGEPHVFTVASVGPTLAVSRFSS